MAQSREALRKLRQKYHLGEYRRKGAKPLTRKHSSIRRFKKMAKRRKSRKGRSGGFRGSSNIWGNVVGVGGVLLYEAYLSPRIPLNGTIKSVAEIVGGLYLSKRSGVVGNVGKAMVVISTYKLMSAYIAPRLGAIA